MNMQSMQFWMHISYMSEFWICICTANRRCQGRPNLSGVWEIKSGDSLFEAWLQRLLWWDDIRCRERTSWMNRMNRLQGHQQAAPTNDLKHIILISWHFGEDAFVHLFGSYADLSSWWQSFGCKKKTSWSRKRVLYLKKKWISLHLKCGELSFWDCCF